MQIDGKMQDRRKKVHVSALDCKESFMLFRSRTEILFIIMRKAAVPIEGKGKYCLT